MNTGQAECGLRHINEVPSRKVTGVRVKGKDKGKTADKLRGPGLLPE